MPAPPPKGASSTLRCGSVAPSRRSCTRTSTSPWRRARPTMLEAQYESITSGKIVNTSMRRPSAAHSKSPVGTSTTRRSSSRPTTNLRGTRLPSSITSRSLAGFACTATTAAVARAAGLDDLAPDQVVHEERVGVLDRLGEQATRHEARRRPRGCGRPRTGRCSAPGTASSCAPRERGASDPARPAQGSVRPLRARPVPVVLRTGGTSARRRSEPLGPVGDEGDDDLTRQPVRPRDPTDLEQWRRGCRHPRSPAPCLAQSTMSTDASWLSRAAAARTRVRSA